MKSCLLPPDLQTSSSLNKSLPQESRITSRAYRFLSSLAFLGVSTISSFAAPYVVNFEGAGETKGAYTSGNVTLNGISWNMTEALIGTDSADFKNGLRSARLRGYTASAMTMQADKPNGAGAITFSYRRYGTDTQVPWAVEYSVDGGTQWTQAGTDFTAPATADVQTFNQTLNVSGNIRFRIICKTTSTSNRRLNIDDITITDVSGSDTTPPAIISQVPAVAATGVAINTPISITFDEAIAAGAGGVQLFKEAGASDVLVPTSAVTIAGATASFTATVPLENSQTYYVLVDSTAITDQASPTPNAFPGILTETAWTFTTVALDVSSPAVVSLSPADDSAAAIPTTNLSITYNEAIAAGSGTVLIKKSSDGSTVDTITVPSAQVSVSGVSATLNPSVVLESGVSYYVEVPMGAFKDLSNNPAPAIAGGTAWNFSIRNTPPLVISQYHEGTGPADRYIELKNLTASPLPLTGYRLTAWSNTTGNEAWKSGTGTTDRVTSLDGYTIPANGYFLVALTNAANPVYAANNNDLSTGSGVTLFNGDDSIVLYSGTGFTQEEVVDAISFTAIQGADISFYRLNDLTGFDFSSGTSILDFAATWATKTPAEVNAAAETDTWYLKATQPPKFITLSIAPTSFSEGAGPAAAAGTVSRTGPTDDPLQVQITFSDDSEASVADMFVTIPIGSASAPFSIDAVNDPFLDGDQLVTVTASTPGFMPDSKTITVLDEISDISFPVVINEVDADQAGTDTTEFIELYNNSNTAVSLDGVVLVLYNGSNDLSYDTIDLSGKTIGPNDYFVIGSNSVANVDMEEFISDGVQNGADAVALYLGTPTDFPIDTPVTPAKGSLVDALVYGTADPNDTALITALTPGKPQADESSNLGSTSDSIARVPNGGAAFDTALFVAQAPTPGATNVLAPVNTLASWISGYPAVGGLTGPNDDFDNDGLDNAVENILGGDPSVSGPGLTSVSSTATSVTFRHNRADSPATDLTASYEWSADLATWYPSGAGGGATVTIGAPVVITDASPNDLVEVTASVTSGTITRLFVRLKVTNP